MPTGVVFPVTGYRDVLCPLPETGDRIKGLLHFFFATDNADQILHHHLEVLLDLVWSFTLATCIAVEGFQRPARDRIDFIPVDRAGAVILRILRRVFTCPLSAHQKV